MCGISGVIAPGAGVELYEALNLLQHRGQDAAGIATCDGMRFFQRKAAGLVRDVFVERHMARLKGSMGLGHVRYPTAGGNGDPGLIQPIYVNSPYGVLLVHNGNLINARELTDRLFREDRRHLNTDSDSEALLNVFASELAAGNGNAPSPEGIFDAVAGVHRRCLGAYSALALLVGHGLVAFRDPWGIRPLVFGRRQRGRHSEYMFASESVALDALGYELLRDVAPGEAIFVDLNGEVHARQCAETSKLRPCIFEYVYLSRPDSMINGISVYKTRLRQGEYLAEKILRAHPQPDIDVIVPVPDTGRVAAQAIAEKLGVDCREGLMKNRYIGRTFIMPDQEQRDDGVRRKLNTIDHEFRDKNVLLVDDSIVRGTTSRQIVALARQAGARNVYFASCAPPVRHPNVYGIDMPAASEFVAHGRSEEEISDFIGSDWLVYQDLEDLERAVREGLVDGGEIERFECSVFDGNYVTGGVDADYLRGLAERRGC